MSQDPNSDRQLAHDLAYHLASEERAQRAFVRGLKEAQERGCPECEGPVVEAPTSDPPLVCAKWPDCEGSYSDDAVCELGMI